MMCLPFFTVAFSFHQILNHYNAKQIFSSKILNMFVVTLNVHKTNNVPWLEPIYHEKAMKQEKLFCD